MTVMAVTTILWRWSSCGAQAGNIDDEGGEGIVELSLSRAWFAGYLKDAVQLALPSVS
jgi:hypothetical protein